MKKLIFVFILILMFVPKAQAFTTTGETMTTPFVTTTEMDAATQKVVRNVRGARVKAVAATENVRKDVLENRRQVRHNEWITRGIIALGIIISVVIIGLLLHRNRQQADTHAAAIITAIGQVQTQTVAAVEQARDQVVREVQAVPAATDKLVKTLPVFEPFMLEGRTVTFVPRIVNGAYQSLYIDAEGVTMRYSSPGKLHGVMSNLLRKYLDPAKRQNLSPRQVALIELSIDDGSLRI